MFRRRVRARAKFSARRRNAPFLALLAATLALAAAGCGGGSGESAETVAALPSPSCGAVEYGGEGEPDVLIASDLPLQGASRMRAREINDAVRLVLEQAGWKAGDLNVAFQACDDATAQAGTWDPGVCNRNAQAYAANASVIGVIGTFNSGCAAIVIPVLNQAPGGGVAMVSPANTDVCLTDGGPGCSDTEPDRYYPSGTRNFARTVANDAFQGAAVAEFLQDKGVTKLAILNDGGSYGLGVAESVRAAAGALGIEVVAFDAWDPKASSYEALFRKIEQAGANGVFLGGVIDGNGGQVIRDKVAVLGSNATAADDGVVLIAPDGFTTQATIVLDEGGATEAKGMYLTVAGLPLGRLGPAGQEFAAAFEAEYGDELAGAPIDPYAVYGAQSAQVLLDAVAKGGSDRAAVIRALFRYSGADGVLGPFSFDENGDPAPGGADGVAVTVYHATAGTALGKVATVISPGQKTVDAARGG